jgi:thiamine transport system substrate-binding protein
MPAEEDQVIMRMPSNTPATTRTAHRTAHRTAGSVALLCAAALALSACSSGSSGKDSGASDGDDKTVTLVAHDSFNVSKKDLAVFEKSSGYTVKVLRSGDAGETVSKAILTKDHPQGDVLFGVDNTLLSRALDAGLFTPFRASGLDQVPDKLRLDDAKNRVTPVDFGDVCVNYDRAYFAKHKLEVPRGYADLTKPKYKNLLVTENAATSSPGLAFLLGSVAEFGEKGYQDYWKKLGANGVDVVNGWEEAYNQRFSGSAASKGKGDRPLAVSYASSPPVEVSDPAKTPADKSPTGVVPGTCFRQIEFAGLLDGAANPAGGKKLINFLLSKQFQASVPGQMYVWPAREDVKPPASWTKYSKIPADPESVPPSEIQHNREKWIKAWQGIVLK